MIKNTKPEVQKVLDEFKARKEEEHKGKNYTIWFDDFNKELATLAFTRGIKLGKHEENERMSAYHCFSDETMKQHDEAQQKKGKLELAREIVEAWKDYSMDTIVERLRTQLKPKDEVRK